VCQRAGQNVLWRVVSTDMVTLWRTRSVLAAKCNGRACPQQVEIRNLGSSRSTPDRL